MIWILFTTYVRNDEQFEMTKRSLSSLKQTNVDYKLFWWDNGSIPKLKTYMMNRCDDYIITKQNKGCIGSRQWAFIYLDYKYLISVDNDILFPSGWLEELLRPFDDKYVGMVSPLIKNDAPYINDYKYSRNMIQGGVLAIYKQMINDIGGISAGTKMYGISDDTHMAMRADKYNWETGRVSSMNCQHMNQATLTEDEKLRLMNYNKQFAYDDVRNWWKG